MNIKNIQGGFTVIEVLMAIIIFSVGVLALASMQITSVQGNDRANIGSEATTYAGDRLEALMALDYDSLQLRDQAPFNGTGQDVAPADGVDESGGNFGLADVGAAADYTDNPPAAQGNFVVSWNIAMDEPVVNSKRIGITVQWTGQDGRLHQVFLNAVKSQAGM